MKERLLEVWHYKRNLDAYKGSLAGGNSLCYPREIDGHFQIPVDPYLTELAKPIVPPETTTELPHS